MIYKAVLNNWIVVFNVKHATVQHALIANLCADSEVLSLFMILINERVDCEHDKVVLVEPHF